MKTISLDLRERILAMYDAGKNTRQEVANHYKTSLGFVKKLLCQRKRTRQIEPRHCFSGRKPKIKEPQRKALQKEGAAKPDLTLQELKDSLGLECSLPVIHYALVSMGLSYKKRRSMPANKTVPTCARPARAGNASNETGIPQNGSLSTKRRPKQT